MGDGDKPPRKRRRGLRWLTGCLIFLIALAAYWLWCDRHASRLLEDELAAIKAAGEPVEFADLAPEPIPDEENAAVLYQQAARLPLVGPVTADTEAEYRRLERLASMVPWLADSKPFRQEHRKDIEDILALSRGALDLCREARSLSRSDWKLSHGDASAVDASLHWFSKMRALARLLCGAALAAHETGNDAKAVEYLRDALALGRSVGSEPLYLHYLIGMSIDALGNTAVEPIAPGLQVAAAPPAATRRQVEALIAELLDETALRKSLRSALIGERAWAFYICRRFRRGRLSLGSLEAQSFGFGTPLHAPVVPEGLYRNIFRPVLIRDTARLVREWKVHVTAAEQDSLPAARKPLPASEEAQSFLQRFRRPVTMVMGWSLGRTFELHFENIAMRRMAAAALAIRLYEIDHGRRPEKLDQLVPKYLPAVPADPFAENGRQITYKPDGEPPLLYSVGVNGKDNGGIVLRPSGGVDREASDVVLYLNGDRPEFKVDWQDPTPPATQPAPPTTAPAK